MYVCIPKKKKKKKKRRERKRTTKTGVSSTETTDMFFSKKIQEKICVEKKPSKLYRKKSFLRVNISSMLTHTHTIKSSEKMQKKEEEHIQERERERTQIPNLKVDPLI